MFGKLKILSLQFILAVAFLLPIFSTEVSAEGDFECSGMMTGTTISVGPNEGRNFFDAHGGPNQGVNAVYYNNAVDLPVWGLTNVLAPAGREYAACVEKEAGVYVAPNALQQAYDYKLKGYVVNDKLGFISLNCEGGFNDAGVGSGQACGPIDYGVYISPVGPDGTRKLFGYGWNSTFGWIDFNALPWNGEVGDPQSCDPVTGIDGDGDGALDFCGDQPIVYGVSLAANGNVSGRAWSEAQVYMSFNGAKIFLPDEEIVPPVAVNDPENWCNGKPYLCIQVAPYPEKLKFGFEEEILNQDLDGDGQVELEGNMGLNVNTEAVKVADGTSGYFVHLYLRDATGLVPMNPAKYDVPGFKNGITLNWKDTVKVDQTRPLNEGVGVQLDNNIAPWTKTVKGAVTFKPRKFIDFVADPNDPTHFISKFPIASFAPTSDANLSLTSGTNPKFPFRNEQFVHDLGLDVGEPNELSLKSISHGALTDITNPVLPVEILPAGSVYPNGKVGMSLKFRPPLAVDTLYVDNLQDKIVAYREIPMNFHVKMDKFGALPQGSLVSALVDFVLDYSEVETVEACGPNSINNFDFHFLNGFDAGASYPDKPVAGGDGVAAVETKKSFLNVPMSPLLGIEKDIQAKATLPEGGGVPCDVAAAPTLYTKVKFTGSFDRISKNIVYYSNKIPRLAGDMIANPVVVVHGNIFAQIVREIQQDVLVQTSGSVNKNLVRDTINENLQKYLGNISNLATTTSVCIITALEAGGPTVRGLNNTTCDRNYARLTIGNENVLYFKGTTKVTIDLDNEMVSGKWVIISDQGNIFIDSNIYNPDDAGARLSLVAFRSNDQNNFFQTGNIYVAPCSFEVKNIQATIIADGSLFSYGGNKTFGLLGAVGAGIDKVTGEPQWSGYPEMVANLSCQLLIEGSIYSDNTIGGADLDKGDEPKKYLLLGGGKIVPANGGTDPNGRPTPITLVDRIKAQYYDLNYLRMFKLNIETTPDGLPVDQKCGRGLTNEDIQLIAAEGVVCGERNDDECDVNGDIYQLGACDGIDPFNAYNEADGGMGDLVAPRGEDLLAKGLDAAADFSPIYIYYKAPAKDSFLFSKAGTVNVGGR